MMMIARPYKKRLLSSLNNQVTAMEIETSDGTERNQSTSPSSQEESEKDNGKESTKTRKTWKKKVCRKQFRHHDIEIFKPGTNRSNCLLKHKETSPTLLKKFQDPIQNEAIAENILHSLVGKKSPQYIQKTFHTSTNLLTEHPVNNKNQNSQCSSMNRSKMTGRHHLPAIVNETPNIRRKSIDLSSGAKVTWTTPTLLPGARRLSIDMPLLSDNRPTENSDILYTTENRYKNITTNDRAKDSISQNAGDNFTDRMDWKVDKSSEQSAVKHVGTTHKMDHEMMCNHRIFDFQLPKERILEEPVDLSTKNSGIKNTETIDSKSKDILSSKPLSQICDYEKFIKSKWFNSPSVLNNSTYSSIVLQESIQQANILRELEEEINYHIAKINNVFQKDFSTNNFRRLCQSYQHLKKILENCSTVPLQIRAYIDNILIETFKYISEKIKHLDVEPIEIIQILGEPKTTQEKVDIIRHLNQIFHHGGNKQTIPYGFQVNYKEVKSPRISPKEKIQKIRYRKKIEELKQHLPPYNNLPPNYINSVTVPKHLNGLSGAYPAELQVNRKNFDFLSQWRYKPEVLTPSPTSSDVSFQSHLATRPSQSCNRPNSLPNMNNLALNEPAAPVNNLLFNRPELVISPVQSAKPAVMEGPNEKGILENRRFLDDQNKIKTIRLEKPDEKKGIGVQKVIVGDISMQITKESVETPKLINFSRNDSKHSKDEETEKIGIQPHSLIEKNKTEIEFLNIIQKLKSEYPEEKMTELLLSQLQSTNKKRKAVVETSEPIEITDSDSEDSRKGTSTPKYYEKEKMATNRAKEFGKIKKNIEKTRSDHSEIRTKTKLDIQTKIRLDKNPIQKTVYSPEIEPISPVEEDIVFQFPDVQKTQKKTFNHTSHKNNIIDKKKNDFPKMKRKKSEESNGSVRVAPHGKLCYIREQNIFLRYFDESQAKLFIENSVLRGDESTENKTVSNQDILPSEKIHIPPLVEFSHKEDIPEPIEFVRELKLVEQYVPKDFAAFYRFVTGYQIVRNKNPVSLQTFLLMYNTNGITELLNKYLNTKEGDQMVPM